MTVEAGKSALPAAPWARRETLSTQVVRAITDRIKNGDYPRGSKLPTEKALIDELGVSRTVVREAIANLRASGHVSIHHGIGVFVREDAGVTPFRLTDENMMRVESVLKGLELRIGIESESAALAAERRTAVDLAAMHAAFESMDRSIRDINRNTQSDFEFHCAVAAASQNEHFIGIFNYLGETLMPRMRMQAHQVNDEVFTGHLQRVNDEHKAIFAEIEKQDAEGARAAMRKHLSDSRDRLIARTRNTP